MLYSFEQPLFTVFITNILLKKTEPYYSFSPRPIRFINNNSYNLKCVKSFIRNSSKWTSNIQSVIVIIIIILFMLCYYNFCTYRHHFYRFKNIEVLVKLVESFFSSLLPTEFLCFEKLYSTRNDEESRQAVSKELEYHETMINAVYDIAKEIIHIKKNMYKYNCEKYSTSSDLNDILKQIQFGAGRIWVLSGMCLLEIFSSMSPVDPQQKNKVRVQCTEAVVSN